LGLALPALQTVPLPSPLACTTPTNIGLDFAITPVVLGSTASVPIPLGLPPFWFAVQCVLVPLNPTCVDRSVASRVAVRPRRVRRRGAAAATADRASPRSRGSSAGSHPRP